MKRGTFIIDGVDSDTIKTYIQDRPLLEAPSRKVEFKDSYGADGKIPFDEEAYDNTNLDLIMVINNGDLSDNREEFYDLIDTKGVYKSMIPYFDPGKIYRYMLLEPVKFENKFYYGNAQAVEVKMTVKPYKYLVESPEVINTGSFTITNPSRSPSQPIIEIEGTGNVTLDIDGVEFRIKDLPNNIIINSEVYSAYQEISTDVLIPMNDHIYSREYPIFQPGVNNVTVTGDISEIKIKPKWRALV